MSRTVFVNPSFANPRRRKSRKGGKSRKGRRRAKKPAYRGTIVLRRNAGISPFVQNPLILSNPRKRRSRRRNPISMPSIRGAIDTIMVGGGSAGLALGVNTMAMTRISNPWLRRAAQAGAAVAGGHLLASKSPKLAQSFVGAMFYPLAQDIAADLLGIGVAAGTATVKEADLEALAADLEDVLDEMDDGDELSDDGDDEEYAW